MSEGAQARQRIAVLRDRRLVPLLTDKQYAFQRDQPWKGVLLERHAVSPGEIPEHQHPDLCLHLQISGNKDFEWWSGGRSGREHTAPGSLILIPPGTVDRLRWTGGSERLILSVQQEVLDNIAASRGAGERPEFAASWAFQDSALRQVLVEMGREATAGWPLGRLYAGLLALGLQTTLLSAHSISPFHLPSRRGGIGLPNLRRTMEYINDNLSADMRLEEIAGVLDLSASHFAHEFRNSTGQTPYQYLLDQRMEKSQCLLRTSKIPVQDVAGLVGFGSTVNFIRTFRRRFGTTPAVWRGVVDDKSPLILDNS